MGNDRKQNSPFIIWSSCFLWLLSLFSITWSLLLFFCVGDILLLTGTDLVNAFVLLSGIIMLPTNVHMLCSISKSRKIDHKTRVVCCPLWMCIIWIVFVNIVGAALCIQRIVDCKDLIEKSIQQSMKHYRSVPQYKHFIDNVQWSMRCCGLNSYRDWFTRDWYDEIRDYEWDPSANKRNAHTKRNSEVDSVPLSCCKSGSCISNYLTELGTYSIHTTGCSRLMYRVIMISMITHLSIFITIVIVEILVLRTLVKQSKESILCNRSKEIYNVKQIMRAKENFEVSSGSNQVNPEDSDMESIMQYDDNNSDKGYK